MRQLSRRKKQIGYLLARIRHIVADEGFVINDTKTRVQKPNSAMTVTGIVVNERAGIKRREIRRLRAILHNAKKLGLSSQNRRQDPGFESRLRGKLSFIQMINPDQSRPLIAAFDSASK